MEASTLPDVGLVAATNATTTKKVAVL